MIFIQCIMQDFVYYVRTIYSKMYSTLCHPKAFFHLSLASVCSCPLMPIPGVGTWTRRTWRRAQLRCCGAATCEGSGRPACKFTSKWPNVPLIDPTFTGNLPLLVVSTHGPVLTDCPWFQGPHDPGRGDCAVGAGAGGDLGGGRGRGAGARADGAPRRAQLHVAGPAETRAFCHSSSSILFYMENPYNRTKW